MIFKIICRLTWQIAWITWTIAVGDIGCQVYVSEGKKNKKKKFKTRELLFVPENFLVLTNCIRICTWFIKLYFVKWSQEPEEMGLTDVLILIMAVGILTFRKGPDLFFEVEGIIFQARQKQFFLFEWIRDMFSWRKKTKTGMQRWFNEIQRQEKISTMVAAKKNDVTYEQSWNSDSVPIVIDSGASRTITPSKHNLINPKPFYAGLEGIGKGKITHKGTISWTVRDEQGHMVQIIDHEAYCSPDAPY